MALSMRHERTGRLTSGETASASRPPAQRPKYAERLSPSRQISNRHNLKAETPLSHSKQTTGGPSNRHKFDPPPGPLLPSGGELS